MLLPMVSSFPLLTLWIFPDHVLALALCLLMLITKDLNHFAYFYICFFKYNNASVHPIVSKSIHFRFNHS